MRLPHETREEMNDRAKVEELLGDWIKPEQGELVRHAVYTFRSLVADEWHRGRVLLAGDAAHLMPPFMGQGMCAGMRDIWNLAWKLDPVLRGTADDTILDTYQLERRPHVSDVIDASIFLGSIICIPDEAAAAQRDEMFLSGNAPPPADFPSLVGGMLDKAADGSLKAPAGELAPHGVVRHRGRTGRLDALVSGGFMLVIDDTIDPKTFSAATWDVLGALGVNLVNVAAKTAASDEQYADVQGQLLPWMQARAVAAMLVRPDFYVFGGAGDKSRLEEVVAELGRQARELGLIREGAPKKAAAQ
jgi:3-(3-hydroxy-phenyl)propionate hydroxylase/flavoprotein hydroxylase